MSIIVKALLKQDRFKPTSLWAELPDGRYKHLQSGKTTSAARLVGFVKVVHDTDAD